MKTHAFLYNMDEPMISFSYCLGIKAKPHPPLLTLLKLKNGSGVRTLVSFLSA